ncbi:MAG: family 2 glycosyl transferase, partial [Marinilabiliales bacterium]
FPYSYYTVGSCFAVNASVYVKQGGMNRKQAGEDFYFLHKVFPLGRCYEINSTCVYPSPRPSDRVPFGTGPMIQSISESTNKDLRTYNFESFIDLKIFLKQVHNLYQITGKDLKEFIDNLPKSIAQYLVQHGFFKAVEEINANSSNLETFKKRFFYWYDAFKVLKYLNFAHEHHYEKSSLLIGAENLLEKISDDSIGQKNCKEYLEIYRSLEREF